MPFRKIPGAHWKIFVWTYKPHFCANWKTQP